MSKNGFTSDDYRRFSDRKRSRELTDEERRNDLLDFIKTNLDQVFYNQYAQSEIKKDYIKLMECIDDKIMPELAFLFERDQEEAAEKIDQARSDLLRPIIEASEQGNEIAQFVLSGSKLKYINPSKYESKLKDTLGHNILLLAKIEKNIEDNNIELFEKNAAMLISILSRSRLNEDDILDIFKDLDRCRNIISLRRDSSDISRSSSLSTVESPDQYQSSYTPPISPSRSIPSISPQEDELMILYPEKYNERINSALNTHSNIIGALNLSISSRDLEGIESNKSNLMINLQDSLDKNDRDEILKDINRIYRSISVQQEAISAVQPIAGLSTAMQSTSPTHESSKSARYTKGEGRRTK